MAWYSGRFLCVECGHKFDRTIDRKEKGEYQECTDCGETKAKEIPYFNIGNITRPDGVKSYDNNARVLEKHKIWLQSHKERGKRNKEAQREAEADLHKLRTKDGTYENQHKY